MDEISDIYTNSLGRQLTIVSGSNPEDIDTASKITKHLCEDYGLEGIILLKSKKVDDKIRKIPRESWPVSYGQFKDGETQFDAGSRALKDFIDNKHVIFVKHCYTPLTDTSINDNIFEIRMFGSVLERANKVNGIQTLKLTLASPYLPYVRSHSIEKYESMGFFQGDSLKLFINDLVGAGIKEVMGVDSHSDKIWDHLKNKGIAGQHIDPFKDPKRKDFRLYNHLIKGMTKKERNKKLIELCPFVETYEAIKNRLKNLSLVEPDLGSYERVREFSLNTGIGLENVISFVKQRDGEGENRIVGLRHYSSLKEEDIAGRNFLMIDDLIASGGTAIETAKYLKERGAKKVYIYVTHNAGRDPSKLQNSKYIDGVIMLDTVRNHEAPKLTYLPKSGILMAGAVYKSHMNLIHNENII